MGKSIIQQARGKGGPAYRIRRKSYRYRIKYPPISLEGQGKITKLINSAAHTAPLAKLTIANQSYIIPAAKGIYEGQEIEISNVNSEGNIVRLKDISPGTKVFNIESVPGKGGSYMRSAGCSATVMNKDKDKVEIIIRRKKIKLDGNCRATIGVAAGDGRTSKPIIKAGKKHHMMKSQGRKWHRTSAVKRNSVDHPFGSGRGKRIKSKISKRDSPPGKKVGHVRPKRTGKTK